MLIIYDFITSRLEIIIALLSFVASLVALFVAWRAYRLQIKSDKDLNRIETAVKELQTTSQQIKEDTKRIEDIYLNIQTIFKKNLFQTALNKYPQNERFTKINDIYQPFIFCLFDEIKYNIKIQINPEKFLNYEIQFVKDETTNIPKKVKAVDFFDFYIIKIIAPSFSRDLTEEELKKYEKSPIREGEYYACRFDEGKCSWILSTLAPRVRKRRFFPFSSIYE